MLVNEVRVERKNPAEIFSIIENELANEPNTQVFISNEIYNELRENNVKYHVFFPNYPKGFHYYHDTEDQFIGGEQWLNLTEGHAFDNEIARASFIRNCNDYMQLVNFDSSKIDNYTHFFRGFEKLLIITF